MRLLVAGLVVSLALQASPARADVLGLKFGMTSAAVKAARPCKAPVANAAKALVACKAVAFAGTKMDAELWLPKTGLARIGLRTRIGARRKDAEFAADSILDKLVADYGPLDMTGVGELAASAALLDGADKMFVQTKGKLKAASGFTAKHLPDATMALVGKLVRDRDGYALELTFTPRPAPAP